MPETEQVAQPVVPSIPSISTNLGRYAVQVNDRGFFVAAHKGEVLSDATFEGLRAKLHFAARKEKVKLSIPVVRLDETQAVRGVIASFHGGTDNPMIRWQGEKGAQQVSSGWGQLLDGDKLSDEDLHEAQVAIATIAECRERIRAIRAKAPFDLRTVRRVAYREG